MATLFKPSIPSLTPPVATPPAAIEPPPLPVPGPAEAPRMKRMPVESDPAIRAAGQRTRQSAMRRKGRLSTIMTDDTVDTTGSGAGRLG